MDIRLIIKDKNSELKYTYYKSFDSDMNNLSNLRLAVKIVIILSNLNNSIGHNFV